MQNRRNFLNTLVPALAGLPILSKAMSLNELNKFTPSQKMPALFLGHGSPMNAIEDNEFVRAFQKIGQDIPKPNAILCISAHWETKGTFVTAMQKPKTIHDFGGFPQALFDVEYPAPGSPELANETKKILLPNTVELDQNWGLDHGAWTVIKHLYPKADVPVVQLSLDFTKNPQYHFDLAKQLETLRHKGILVVGSGNMVHNLGLMAWKQTNNLFAFDWAKEANEKMKKFILSNDVNSLINYSAQGKAFQMAIPSAEHYLPLLYVMALKQKNEKITLFNDKPIAGSLSMTSLKLVNFYL